MRPESDVDPASLAYDDRGLVAVVAQDAASGAVLMLAWADREAVEATLATGEAHFRSRSRGELWKKGATSGNIMAVAEVLADCDRDALLYRVHPAGPACHLGGRTCFEPNPARLELGWLWQVLESRRAASPEESYTARLLAAGAARAAQKVGEEAVETVIASLAGDAGELVAEASDLVYHLLVLLLARGVEPDRLAAELVKRHASPGGSP